MARPMRLVRSHAEIRDNLLRLEHYRTSSHPREREYHARLVGRGVCFVVLQRGSRLLFGPSRFVGYIRNSTAAHEANRRRDGRETNVALTKILGCRPRADRRMEHHYRALCAKVGIACRPTGAFGVARKYWPVL
jgi:hypothetical protein